MRTYSSAILFFALACISCGEVETDAVQDGGGRTDASAQVDGAAIDGAVGDANTPMTDAAFDSGVDCPLGAICSGAVNYAFVTSMAYPVEDIRTTLAADGICNQLAMDASLPGTYVAWLSTDAGNARSRLGTANGWVRPDRRPFAASRGSLLNFNQIIHPLDIDENGQSSVDNPRPVMTGSTSAGQLAAICPANSGTSDRVQVGKSTRADDEWSASGESSCTDTFRMYCFGVDNDVPLKNLPVVVGRKAWVSNQTLSAGAGRDAMDAACAVDAVAAGVTGPVIALVALTNEPAASRLNTNGPTWVRTDGVVLWEQASDILTKNPLAPISLLANGAPTPGTGALSSLLLTGAESVNDFAMAQENCRNWDEDVFIPGTQGIVGISSSIGQNFFQWAILPCGASLSVYCFEQ